TRSKRDWSSDVCSSDLGIDVVDNHTGQVIPCIQQEVDEAAGLKDKRCHIVGNFHVHPFRHHQIKLQLLDRKLLVFGQLPEVVVKIGRASCGDRGEDLVT